MRVFSLALNIAVLAVAFGQPAAVSADPIKIGVNMPLTGAFSASGTFVANGARIAAEEINAKGGVIGRPLELIVEDNKSNPTEAAAVAEKLVVRDKVSVMMGAWGSTLTLAALPKLMQYKIPMLVETAGADKITQSGNPYVFRISAPALQEAKGFEKRLPEFGIRKADFLIINNDWGRSTALEFSKILKKNNIEVGFTEIMDQSAQDLGAQITKLRGSDSDTVIVTAAVEQLTLILKQAQSLGLNKKIITTGGSQNPDQLIEQAGRAADGSIHLVFFTPWSPELTAHPEQSRQFIDAWAKKGYAAAGLTESFRGYDGVQVIAAAIEAAGSADPAAVGKALWDVKVKNLNGEVVFRKSGPEGRESAQSDPSIYFVKITDGKVAVLQ